MLMSTRRRRQFRDLPFLLCRHRLSENLLYATPSRRNDRRFSAYQFSFFLTDICDR